MGCTDSKEDGTTPPLAIPDVPVLENSFFLGEALGAGTAGTVYFAKDTRTQEDRAVKVLNMFETAMSTVKREAHMLQQLKHPCLVAFYGLYMKGHAVCLVMDYYPGGSLSAARGRDAKEAGGVMLDIRTIQNITRGVSLAAEWLHHHLIVHRDLKAQNLLVDRRNLRDPAARVALCDLATCTRLTHKNERMTRETGTKLYWAPEFWLSDYGMKVDSWALGSMSFELIWEVKPTLHDDECDAGAAWDRQVSLRNGRSYDNPALKAWVCGLLTKDEEGRLSTTEALQHEFLLMVRSSTEQTAEMPARPTEKDDANFDGGKSYKPVQTCGHCAVAVDGEKDNNDRRLMFPEMQGDSFASMGSLVELAITTAMVNASQELATVQDAGWAPSSKLTDDVR